MTTTNNNPMAVPQLLTGLRQVSPSIAFSVTRGMDQSYEWEGDGPDPLEAGYEPYNVTVSAFVIIHGEVVTGIDYMCGCYYRPDEPCGDVNGYLHQMLVGALDDLRSIVGEIPAITDAREYLASNR